MHRIQQKYFVYLTNLFLQCMHMYESDCYLLKSQSTSRLNLHQTHVPRIDYTEPHSVLDSELRIQNKGRNHELTDKLAASLAMLVKSTKDGQESTIIATNDAATL